MGNIVVPFDQIEDEEERKRREAASGEFLDFIAGDEDKPATGDALDSIIDEAEADPVLPPPEPVEFDDERFAKMLREREDRLPFVYTDTTGHRSVATGMNLEEKDARSRIEALGVDFDDLLAGRVGLTDEQMDKLDAENRARAFADARALVPTFSELATERQLALADMAYNMGRDGLGQFGGMLGAIEKGDFNQASREIIDSVYALQVGNRATLNARAMKGIVSPPDQQRAEFLQAFDQSPDDTAKALQAAEATGLPPDVALRNPQEAARIAQANEATDLIGSITEEWLAEQDNLIVAQDGLPELLEIENVAGEITFLGSLMGGGDRLQGSWFRFLEWVGEASNVQALADWANPRAVEQMEQRAARGGGIVFSDVRTTKDFVDWIQFSAGDNLPTMAPTLAGAIAGGYIGAAIGAPGGPLALVTGSLGALIGGFLPNLIIHLGENEQALKERGGEEVEAPGAVFTAATINAGLDSILGSAVVGRFVKTFGKEPVKLLWRQIATAVAIEAGKGGTIESITEAMQEAITTFMVANELDLDIDARELGRDMMNAAAAAFFLGMSVSTVGEISSQKLKQRQRVHKEKVKTTLKTISEKAKKSKLHARYPRKSREHIERVLKAIGVKQVIITEETLSEFAAVSTDPARKLNAMGVLGQMNQAAALEEGITMDVGQFVEHILLAADNEKVLDATDIVLAGDKKGRLEAQAADIQFRGRIRKLRDEIGVLDVDIEGLEADLEARREAGRPTDRAKKALKKRVAKREELIDEQETLEGLHQAATGEATFAGLSIEEKDAELIDKDIDEATAELKKLKRRKPTDANKKLVKDAQKRLADLKRERADIIRTGREAAQEGITEETRKKPLEVTGKTVEALAARAAEDRKSATRKSFRAGVKAGEKNMSNAQRIIIRALEKSGVPKAKLGKFLKEIPRIKNIETLKKRLPAIEQKVLREIEADARKTIRAETDKVLKASRLKKGGFKPVSKLGDADIQALLLTARHILFGTKDMSKTLAAERLEQNLKKMTLTATERFENALYSIRSRKASLDDELAMLETLRQLLSEGKEAKKTQHMAHLAEVKDLIEQSNAAITEGRKPARLQSEARVLDRLRKGAKSLGIQFGAAHWDWDMWLLLAFNRPGVDATFIQRLRMTKSIQKVKKLVQRWQAELDTRLMQAYGFETQGQLMSRRYANAKVAISKEFYNPKTKKTVLIEYTVDEAIKFWMEMQDPDLQEVYLHKNGMGYTDDMVNAIYDVMEDGDKKAAQAMLDFYRRLYPAVNRVYRRIYNVDLPFREFYSNIQRDRGAADVDEEGFKPGHDRIHVEERDFRQRVQRQLRTRTLSNAHILKRSSTEAMYRYMHDMAHFIEVTEQANLLQQVFADPTLQKNMDAHMGTGMTRIMTHFIEDYSNGYPKRGLIAERWIGWFNRQFAKSVLAFKETIGMKQVTSYFIMSEDIPTGEFYANTLRFLADPRKWVELIYRMSSLMQERGSSIDFEIAKLGSVQKPLHRMRHGYTFDRIQLIAVHWGDRLPIYMGGAARIMYMTEKLGLSMDEAIDEFEDHVSTTQQSNDIDKLSEVQRMGAIGRTGMMFMTARLALLRGEYRAFTLWRRGKITPAEFAKRIFYYHMAMPMMIQFIASGFRWEGDRQLTAALLGQLNAFFLLGDFLNWFFVSTIAGDGYKLEADMPVLGAFEQIGDALLELLDGEVDVGELLEVTTEIADTAGLFMGVGVEQLRHKIIGGYEIFNDDPAKGVRLTLGWSMRVAEGDEEITEGNPFLLKNLKADSDFKLDSSKNPFLLKNIR